jgi:RNA polymerase sigma-70 factor (ECF subfamily)
MSQPANALPAGSLPAAHDALLSDDQIVARILGGDIASFEIIMRRYNQRLFRIVRGLLDDDAEAEDALQEAYLHAYQQLAQFKGLAQFSTWLTKIAVYEAMARVRRRTRSPRLTTFFDAEGPAMSTPADRREPPEDLSQQELGRVLSAAVDALPPGLRSVFVMRIVEGLSTEETAECLDLTPANVKVRLHRARELLRASIDRRIGAEARKLYQFDGHRCDRIVRQVAEKLQRLHG